MKKFTKILAVFVLTLITVFSFSACTFVFKNSEFTPTETPPPAEILGVNIKEQPVDTRQLLTLEQANVKVERSIVAIETTGGAGAGVIIDLDIENVNDDNVIYIATCHHVIESKGDIAVYIPDAENPDNYLNTDYIFTGTIGGLISDNQNKAVTLVGSDFKADIGVIKIDLSKPALSGNTLSVSKIIKAVIPTSDYKVTQGETVFAIGNPTGGLPGWLCSGIVASLEETIPVSDIGNMKLMGISAPTNPGNSGGGLFNMYGELIGITNAGNTAYDAINFAIPLYTSDKDVSGSIDNGVVNMVQQLVASSTATNYGYVAGRKVMFGITVAKNANSDDTYILSVTEGSLAQEAGIKKDDVIIGVKVNDVEKPEVDTYEEINQALASLKIGDKVTLRLKRKNTQTQTTTLEVSMTTKQYHFCNTGL